jgi:hypothetical protein
MIKVLRGTLMVIAALFFLSSCVTQKGQVEQPPRAAETPPAETTVEKPPAVEAVKPAAQFVVTEELYERTFNEIAAVVAELDSIIREKNFNAWLGHLSREYIARTSSREFLEKASKSTRLSAQKVVLTTLQDYFVNVVVQSRLQATLDDILFVDAANVKAMTVVNGESYILYWLTREDDAWKIGIVQDL